MKGFSQKILSCNSFVSVKNSVNCLFACRCSSNVFERYGNKVVNNSSKYYTTQVQQKRSEKTTYNSRYKYGRPHSESNIPNVEFNVGQNETEKEQAFRQHKENLMSWHHTFWLQQNQKFNKEKKEYLHSRECKNNGLTDGKEQADELSLFYKEFLDKNFLSHFEYQREWYKRNFLMLWYGLQVDLERLLKKLLVKVTRSKSGYQ